MILKLALRNVLKNFSKRLPLTVLLTLTIFSLFLGNTLFENADRGFQVAYVQSFTGDLSISAQGREQFTIFGSDLPLVGETLVLPVIPKFPEVEGALKGTPGITSIPLVSAAGAMDWNGFTPKVPVFGVDFPAYFQFFPSLKLIKGSLPSSGSPGILLNQNLYQRAVNQWGKEPQLGDLLTLSFTVNNSFVIREVAFAGVYAYPVSDLVLDRIVLTDVHTARALNGYVYGAQEGKTTEVLDNSQSDDSVFDNVQDSVVDNSNGINLQTIESTLADNKKQVQLSQSIDGAWNFLILKTQGLPPETVKTQLNQTFSGQGLQIRDWRETAGGNSQIVWLLRILFNAGFIFIALVTTLIVINSFSLSLTERTKEIGTMRALGAQKFTVAKILSMEILILVLGAGTLGILLGVGAAVFGTMAQIPIENVFLAGLLGSNVLSFQVSVWGIFSHLGLCFLIGAGALAVPVQRALKITPSRAMSRE